MSDFFSAVGDGLSNSNLPDDTQSFADAIAARYGQGDENVLTARLLPPMPIHSIQAATTFDGQYTAVPPSALSQWLDDPRTLVVDIRPHAAYSSARIGRAVSLSVPSTLLKRPAFSLQRLSAMLPSVTARTRFSAWRTAPRILVYDADSITLSETSNIQGLLRKFRADAPNVALAWIQGGFQTVWQTRRDLVDAAPPTPETETEDDADDDPDSERVLRAHHLPRAAFALASTTQAPRRAGPALLNPAQYPNANYNMASSNNYNGGLGKDTSQAFNPFYDAVRQNTELAHGITERIPLRLPRRVRRRVQELPFQWLRDIARRAAPVTPPDANANASANPVTSASYGASGAASFGPYAFRGRPDSSEDETESSDSSSAASWRSTLVSLVSPHARASDIEEGTEALAMQFYRIELAEQRRMMDVMEHHSRESEVVSPHSHKGDTDANADASESDGQKSHGGSSDSMVSTTSTSGSGTSETDATSVSESSGSGSGDGGGSASGDGGEKRRRIGLSLGLGLGLAVARVGVQVEVEKYRNIWPFEHARVRLHRLQDARAQTLQIPAPPPSRASVEDLAVEADVETETETEEEYDNYINASHVYCDAGPLEATFGDFWTLVWQQNIHLIVMLTREVEGATIKCGAYWKPGTYGPLRVELLGCAAEGCTGVCALCSAEAGAEPGGGAALDNPPAPPSQLIKRTLRLTHAAYPEAPPRRIVQLHYLGWPDMNVPEDASGVLGLVWEVGKVVEDVGRESVERERAGKGKAVRASNSGSGVGNAMEEDQAQDNEQDINSSSDSDSEVDSATGVLRRALRAGDAAAPVLLHCSAGVGRTGGFIAVDAVLDAVRQEAREMYAAGTATQGRVSTGISRMESVRSGSEGIGAIDAGMRASGISGPPQEEDDQMDVDVQVEDADMHEGRGMRTPMQIDSAEVEFGETTRRWAERVADTKVLSAFSFAPGSLPQTAFPSSIVPATGTGSSLPSSTLGTPFHLPPTPSTHLQSPENKSSSLPIKMPTAGLSLAMRRGYADRLRTFSAPSAAVPPVALSTDSTPWLVPPKSSTNSPLPGNMAEHVDYKEPRVLHGRGGARPVRLSAFDDPIWEVVQDMREQRMSLCQSFRQYVFVHAAIIEGALLVVDEERARAGISWRPPTRAPTPRRGGLNAGARPSRPTLFLVPSDETKSTTSSTGKRLASPTELPKEDKKGEIALSKRPSIKRKQPSADEYAHPLATFPPP
ncbi:hypothetical protein K438DRAFT_1804548 [Mycena galopus ATCC 62051]|nr:hypothetical protein K438DRAFT_1804548 [Mycena galopus ATCC 62051]